MEAMACHDYDGIEVSPLGHPEAGYLALRAGERVEVLGAKEKGHARNRAPEYVFGALLGNKNGQGWFPAGCVQVL